MAHTAERGLVWIRRWCGAASGVVCQFRIVGSVHSSLVRRTKSPLKPNKSGWGEHKRVVDESGFRGYRASVDWGLSFLSVRLFFE